LRHNFFDLPFANKRSRLVWHQTDSRIDYVGWLHHHYQNAVANSDTSIAGHIDGVVWHDDDRSGKGDYPICIQLISDEIEKRLK
jgi:hypothetical protein